MPARTSTHAHTRTRGAPQTVTALRAELAAKGQVCVSAARGARGGGIVSRHVMRAAQEHDAYVARVGAESASREIAVSVARSKEGMWVVFSLVREYFSISV